MILVTGGCGLIASNLPGDDLIFTDLLPGGDEIMDVTDPAQTEAVILRYQPSAVVHCAAWIDPDQCERDPAGCFRVNVVGTMNVLAACLATVGQVGNVSHENVRLGKAGRSRWLGRRPEVRGVAMNPVDHPLGGGEGKSSGGRHPVSPWGMPTKGYKTRKKKKPSSRLIVKRRGQK